jgi:hypothetical protein
MRHGARRVPKVVEKPPSFLTQAIRICGKPFVACPGEHSLGVSASGSNRNHVQAGDEQKVLHVEGSYVEAEMKGRGSDDQIFEWDGDAFGGLLTFDAPGELGDFEGDGVDDQCSTNVFHENSATFSMHIGLGPVNTMRQFNNTDCGECTFCIAITRAYSLHNLLDGVTTPFRNDEYGGVEN